MKKKRVERLNSLLKEVISEVIREDVRNPSVGPLTTVTAVEITTDLHFAKVSISVIGNDEEKKKTIEALNSSSGYIGVLASKKVVLRYFPSLSFKLDTSVDEHMKIEKILGDIHQERLSRPHSDEHEE